MRRVVVTGMGIVSSIGNNAQEVTASLHDARSGIVKADDYARLGFRCQVHGAPNYDLDTVADICGAPKDLIEQLAKDFGRRFWDTDFVGKPREENDARR